MFLTLKRIYLNSIKLSLKIVRLGNRVWFCIVTHRLSSYLASKRINKHGLLQGWLKSAILGGSTYKDLGLGLGGSSYKEINPVPEAARNRI